MSTYTILDARGALLRDYHGASYTSCQTADGTRIPSWQDGLSAWIDKTLLPLLDASAPRTILACFDGGSTLRRAVYPGYKQARRDSLSKAPPEQAREITTLIEKAQRLLAYLGVRCVTIPGEEADDLIALFAAKLPPAGHPVVIHTSDEDLLQLVGPGVSVVRSGILYSTALPGMEQANKYGIPHDLIRLRKSIVGDTSDDYPGVKGAGPKFFDDLAALGVDWLRWLESVIVSGQRDALLHEGVQQALGKAAAKLHAQFDEWAMGYFLAALHPECAYGTHKGAPKRPVWQVRVPSWEKVSELLTEIAWSHRAAELYSRLGKWFPRELAIDAGNVQTLIDVMPAILAAPIVSYDFESTDRLQHAPFREDDPNFVDVLSQEITGISVNFGDNLEQTLYVAFAHAETANLTKDWAVWLLASLNTRQQPTVVQNAAFELSVAKTDLGLAMAAPFDTKVMAVYVDENLETGLKSLSKEWLRYTQATYKEVTQGRAMHELTLSEVLSYGCDDSLVTSHLFDVFRLIMILEGTWDFYRQHEVEPAIDDVAIFIDGTAIDLELMKGFEVEAAAIVEQAKAEIHKALGEFAVDTPRDEATLRASALLHDWWSTAQLKYREAPEKAAAAYQALWEKAWAACFYQPPTTRQIGRAWSATAKQVNELLAAIDPQAPEVWSTSQKELAAWYDSLKAYLNGHPGQEQVKWHLSELGSRLHGARKHLTAAKRTSQEYQCLADYAEHLRTHYNLVKTEVVGDGLNFRSPDQMQGLIYGKLGLPIRRRSKVQRGSTRDLHKLPGSPAIGLKAIAAALVQDVIDHDDWRHGVLLNYREVCLKQQEASLYYDKYPLLVHPRDGRIHPQIINCGTVTRRPTGTAPNALQVSKKDDAKIRKCYVGGDYGDGPRVYVAADFANQELVLTACESKDAQMLSAFLSNPRKDIHSVTSTGYAHILAPRFGADVSAPLDYDAFYSALHGEDKVLSKAMKEVRKISKTVNFGLVYGMSPTALAENLLIPLELAKQLMEGTFELYSRIRPWQQEVIEFARTHGYSVTAYGNRRHATKDLWSDDKGTASRMERQLVNAVIQSCAADILKQVRQEMHRRKMRERYAMKATKFVYDEVSASVPFDRAADYAEELLEVMTITPPGYPVGMKVDLSIGWTWGSVDEVDSNRAAIEQHLDRLALDKLAMAA